MLSSSAITYQIQLSGKFHQSGIGFSCMKTAKEYGLNGSLEYLSESKIQLIVRGTEEKLIQFYRWCKHLSEVRSYSYQKLNDYKKIYQDFILINSI